jgi:transglutaminase-like putative cysteine protease
MMSVSIHVKRLRKTLFILAACTLPSLCAHAQDHFQDHYEFDSIAAKYKNENAVYTDITHRLVIKEEDYKLVATSYVSMDKLFISDLSLSLNSTDHLYYSSVDQLDDLDAFAYLPVKSGYKKVRCHDFANVHPRDYVFYDDNRAMVVLYSGLTKNSITRTKYSIDQTEVNSLLPFEFQEDIPVVKETFEVVAPSHVHMNFVMKGEHTDWIKQTKEEKNGIVTYRFTATDVPPAKSFSNVPSWHYYLPHVIPYITSYKFSDAQKPVDMLSKPDDLYKYLYKYVRNLNMKEDTAMNRVVAEITRGDVSPREKAMHIYQWVQKNIHYIAFEYGLEGGYTPREASLVFKRKFGDCKDMSNVLVAMCNRAGLQAYHTWIGTDQLPYVLDETPLSLASNHMICALKLGDEWLFMDGTDPVLPFGCNREDIQGKEAMIAIDAKNYKIITVPAEAAEKNIIVDNTMIHFSDNADRKVEGSAHITYSGYPAWDIAYALLNITNEDKEKLVKRLALRGSNKYHQNSYTLAANAGGNRDVSLNTNFTIDNYVQKVGKEYYVNMNLDRKFEDERINEADRKAAYYFEPAYKKRTKEVVTLDIPKGYKITHLPKDAQGGSDGLWSYKISYKADKNQVTLTKEYQLNTLSVSPAKFAEHNKLVDDVKKLYKESVVLTTK